MSESLRLVPIALAAALVAWAVAGGYRRWAVARAVLDVPNHRSSHAIPTPTGGGVGIVVGFLVGLALWLLGGGSLSPRARGWLAGALLVAAVSFVDDVRRLPASIRLATHLAGAALLTVAGVQGGDPTLVLALPLAFVWVAVVTNVYNFMDGIDGLAAAQAIVAGLAYAAAGAFVGNPLLTASGSLLAATALGFFPHNAPPARLFMGDVGSTFLGFSFAGLALLGNIGVGGGKLPLEFGAVVLAPFLFDGLATLARRMLRGERWFEAHRSHYYQRLVQARLTHGRVTTLYAGLAVVAAAAALLGLTQDATFRPALAILAYLPMLGVVALTWRLERGHPRSVTT